MIYLSLLCCGVFALLVLYLVYICLVCIYLAFCMILAHLNLLCTLMLAKYARQIIKTPQREIWLTLASLPLMPYGHRIVTADRERLRTKTVSPGLMVVIHSAVVTTGRPPGMK